MFAGQKPGRPEVMSKENPAMLKAIPCPEMPGATVKAFLKNNIIGSPFSSDAARYGHYLN